MSSVGTITIKKGREKSLQRKHPWVFSGAIQHVEGSPEDGDLVMVLSSNKQFLGLGHYQNNSITVKVLSWQNAAIDQTWFDQKLEDAKAMRNSLGLPSEATNAYRLAHGEGDGLPGLIIDIYNDVAVIQSHSPGMTKALKLISRSLQKIGFKNIISKPVGKEKPTVLEGEVSEITTIKESGAKYQIDIIGGQKTGFFLDQRDNRDILNSLAKNSEVFNVFSYTGGFSVSALAGGANKVTSVDSSASALALADQNAVVNDFAEKHSSLKVDAVPYLENMQETYPIIVLDPPAFAKHKSARHNAIQAYRRINEAAIKKVQKGGYLLTFSCSQVVDRQMFYDTVVSAAINAGRDVQVLKHLRQPADHPVSLFHPEGEYLKGLLLRVS
jgi:23S rRNA (cytosine1962-C5)-methyltransferase